MYKRIKVRLYPTVKQKQLLDNHFNAYRYCYNLCLEYKSTMWSQWKINKSGYDMQAELFQIRKSVPWLSNCKAECLRDAALNVDKSFQRFFKGNGYPKFKSKNTFNSFTSNQSVSSKAGRIHFFKRRIKYRTSTWYSQLLETNKIKKCTFKKDKSGTYWGTCLIEIPNEKTITKLNTSIGIDLGIKTLVITSTGEKFENKKHLINSHYKLTRIQRQFSKTKKEGKNRGKLRLKVAKLHRKITNQKEHYYHQITNQLIRENQTIVIETLKAQNMMKNHKLARNISDASWGVLTSMLAYKSNWHDKRLIKIGTFFPSSKTCSTCGNIKETLLLSERTYDCERCGSSIDRDVNAAINIRNEGLRIAGLPVEDTINRSASEAGSKSLIINN